MDFACPPFPARVPPLSLQNAIQIAAQLASAVVAAPSEWHERRALDQSYGLPMQPAGPSESRRLRNLR